MYETLKCVSTYHFLSKLTKIGGIFRHHIGDYEDYTLLRYNVIPSRTKMLPFLRNLLPPPSCRRILNAGIFTKKIMLKMEENSATAFVVREKSPTLKMQAQ